MELTIKDCVVLARCLRISVLGRDEILDMKFGCHAFILRS